MSKNMIIAVVVGIVIFSIIWYNKTHPTATTTTATGQSTTSV